MSKNTNNQPPKEDPKGGGNGENKDQNIDKKFTQEQLDEIVSKRVNEVKEKAEQTIAEKVKEAQAEAERNAKLSEEERRKEEEKKRTEQMTKREQELALRESRIEARDLLQSKGIATELVDFVVDTDLEKTKEKVDTLEKAFTKAVENGVAEKLKGKSPEDFSGNNKDKKSVAKTGQIAF